MQKENKKRLNRSDSLCHVDGEKFEMLQMANRRLIRAVFSYHQRKEMRTYLLVILILMNQCVVRVGHKAEVYNMLIVAGTIEL